MTTTLQILKAITFALTLGSEAYPLVKELTNKLKQLHEEDREITDSEWNEIVTKADAVDSRIRRELEA